MLATKTQRQLSIARAAAATFFATLAALLFINCTATPSDITIAPPVQVLEIRSDAKGMLDVVGETLYFRLINDGTAEFEFPDSAKQTSPVSRAEDVNVLRKINLDEKEKNVLTESLSALIGDQRENKYQRKCCCTDTQVDFRVSIEIDGGNRLITLVGYCDLADLINERTQTVPPLPPALIDLFRRIDNLRSKYKAVSK